MELTLYIGTPEDMLSLGAFIGERLKAGDVIALTGDLGAGKTCFSQGVAQGLDVPEDMAVVSPTFTLANEYPGRIPFFHLDVYRLTGEDFEDSGLHEYFSRPGATVVEWAERIEDELPDRRLDIVFSIAPSGVRRLAMKARGSDFDEILMQIEMDFAV